MRILHKITQIIAYKRYEKRGKSAGFELDDWVKAESRIMLTRRAIFIICSLICLILALNLFSFNKYIILSYSLLCGLLIISAWQLWKPKRFLSFLTAAATIAMAITSYAMFRTSVQTRTIQEEGLFISKQLGDLQEKANNQNLIRLQSELRPYLIPELLQNPPHFTIDNQSVMTFTPVDGHLYVTFILNNGGKMPARNVRAKYDSPGIFNHDFDLAENVIMSESSSQRYWTPHVNIQKVINAQENEPFDVVLIIEYDGNEDIANHHRYVSLFKLEIQKDVGGKYRIIDQNLNFRSKEE